MQGLSRVICGACQDGLDENIKWNLDAKKDMIDKENIDWIEIFYFEMSKKPIIEEKSIIWKKNLFWKEKKMYQLRASKK